MTPLLIWGGAALAYAGFRLWYDGIPRPLAAVEIDELMTRLPATTLADARELANLRTFLAADDGREFVMANLVRLAPEPVPDPDTGKLTRSRDLLERYTADFFPTLSGQYAFRISGNIEGTPIDATFTSGPGAKTLPMEVFSSVRMGVSPQINALATIFIVVVTTMVVIANQVAFRRRV